MIQQQNCDTHYLYDNEYPIGEENFRPQIMEHNAADAPCNAARKDRPTTSPQSLTMTMPTEGPWMSHRRTRTQMTSIKISC